MITKKIKYNSATVHHYFDTGFTQLEQFVTKESTILLVDENFYLKNKRKLSGWKYIIVPSGEHNKIQHTVNHITDQLLTKGTDKGTTLIGVGGGMVTDITGFVASVYMRGLKFGFVPTTILAMTDAAIGGKNGINFGLYKNMIGLVKQPEFILFDYSLLKTLPEQEWINGFAEIIKHACIKDRKMFELLEATTLSACKKDFGLLSTLIMKNAMLKSAIVCTDEFEKSERKLLNFGHTIGHAIENLYQIPHGHAVSIGMGVACKISEKITGFKGTNRVVELLKKYGLPPQFDLDTKAIWKILTGDKKIKAQHIDYIVLNKIGQAAIAPMPLQELQNLLITLQ